MRDEIPTKEKGDDTFILSKFMLSKMEKYMNSHYFSPLEQRHIEQYTQTFL